MSRLGRRVFSLLIAPLWVATAASASAGNPPQPAGWSAVVLEGIHESEYHFSEREDGSWSAPNREQNFRLRLTPEGAWLAPRVRQGEGWEIPLRLSGVRRGGAGVEVGAAELSARKNRIELRRDLLTEWFVNEPRGLEHGFTIPTPPLEGGREAPLVLEVATAAAALAGASATEAEIVFRSPSGRSLASYRGIEVRDAGGRPVPARLALGYGGVMLVIEDREAVYPIEVDPLLTSPDWTAGSAQVSSRFGISVGTAGDVNNDGFDDIIVGADEYDNGEVGEGRVFVYMGSATGPGITPAWTAESNQPACDFGFSVGTAGDVNNDGFDDVIIGAHRFSNPETDEGVAFVYHGSATGLSANGTRPVGDPTNANWRAESNQVGAGFGKAVARAGDVNNDGFDDVIIGADEYDKGQSNEGAAFVYHGSLSGLNLNGMRPVGTPSNANWVGESNRVNADYGYSVASAGDVNGDFFDDVVVGAWNHDANFQDDGRAFVYLGSILGLDTNFTWSLDGDQDSAELGIAVAGCGNVNGDGFDDVIVGVHRFDNDQINEGQALVFHGSALGLSPVPNWSAESDQTDSEFGFAVASAGDMNNDGFADVVVGAYEFDGGQTDEGRVFVHLGAPGGLPSGPGCTLEVNQAGASFGRAVSSAGDVNNDGFADLIVGASTYAGTDVDQGAAFLYLGCADGDRDCTCAAADCNDADAAVYGLPGEALSLQVGTDNDKKKLTWVAPSELGGLPSSVRYDVLRSGNPADFNAGAICVESDDGPNTTATDTGADPLPGAGYYYLVRAENVCGVGSLGHRSNNGIPGAARTGRSCP